MSGLLGGHVHGDGTTHAHGTDYPHRHTTTGRIIDMRPVPVDQAWPLIRQLRANLAEMDDWLETVLREQTDPAEATPEKIATRLRQAIESTGLTHQQVAMQAEIEPTALSKVLAGTRRLSSLELAMLSQTTGVSVHRLLYGPAATLPAAPAPAPGDEGLRARIEAWIEYEYGCTPADQPHTFEGSACPGCELRALSSPAPAATEVGEGER